MKRFLSIVLAVVCCVSLSSTAFAQAFSPLSPRYSHLDAVLYKMTISSGTANVSGKVILSNGDACEIVATIEQEVDGSWQEVKTFSVYSASASVAINKKWMLAQGYSYRCVFQVNAYEGGALVESCEFLTDEKWY